MDRISYNGTEGTNVEALMGAGMSAFDESGDYNTQPRSAVDPLQTTAMTFVGVQVEPAFEDINKVALSPVNNNQNKQRMHEISQINRASKPPKAATSRRQPENRFSTKMAKNVPNTDSLSSEEITRQAQMDLEVLTKDEAKVMKEFRFTLM